uniref:Uncharacterized protein n=1 Tax=Schlesneria paludicola TaxID=360056 RepID=A0A7C2JYF6_9PLAN
MSLAHTKPGPLIPTVSRPLCPVCGVVSYSREGIHPQCAMVAADSVLVSRINARKAAEPKPERPPLRRFERICPACQAVQHVRRRSCECGRVL